MLISEEEKHTYTHLYQNIKIEFLTFRKIKLQNRLKSSLFLEK